MSYQGDLLEDQILYFEFTSRREDTGVPIVLDGTPSLAIYADDGTTQSTAGITLTVSHDSIVGKNMVKIDTSADAFYATGADYSVVIAAGTVNSNSVVGEVVGSFSIENRSTTALATALTTIDTVVDRIEVDTQDIQTQIGTDGAGLTNMPWNSAWDAEVQSEVADALNAYDPPTNTEMVAAFTEIKGATWATTDSLEAIRNEVVVVDGIVDTILVDTADLQGNQGAWATATGFSTHSASDVTTDMDANSTNLNTIISDIGTVDTVVDALATTIGTAGDGLTAINLPNQTMDIVGNITGNISGSVGSLTGHTNQTGDTYALANGSTGFAAIDTVVDAILVDTGTTLPAQIGALSSGAGGISATSASATVTTGTETLTYAATAALNGTTHDVAADGGNTDFYYEFNVGVTGVATEVLWNGYVQSQGDSYTVWGWDWIDTAYVQVDTLTASNGTTVAPEEFIFTNAMTGTGADAGKVRLRFLSTDGTEIFTDRVLCEYTALIEAGTVLHSGIAQSGTTNTIVLDSGASSIDKFYNHARVVVSSGTGSEQERIIVEYTGSTRTAKVAPPWVTNPDSTSAFEIEPATVHSETTSDTIKVGLATAATGTTITLDGDASTVDDFYNEAVIHIDSGTGEGESRVITDYVGSTKVATVSRTWFTTPDTTSEYVIENGTSYAECLSSVAQADVNAACDTALSDYDPATHTELVAEIDAVQTDIGTLQTTADAIETDTQDLQTQIGTAGDGLGDLGGMSTAMKAEVNAEADTAITDYDPPTNAEMEARTVDAATVAKLEAGALATVVGAAATGTLSTTVMTTNLSEATDDHYNGRVVVFTSGVLLGQAAAVSDYSGTNGTITMTAVTEAPGNADTFVIV